MGAFDRLTGFPQRERGAQGMLFDIVHPQDKSYILEQRQRALERGELASEYRILTKEGQVRWVRDKTWVEYDPDGQPLRVYLAGQDITEHKNADAEIHRRVQELAALTQVSTALRSAQRRAEMLPIILDQVMDLFKAGGAAFEMMAPQGEHLAHLLALAIQQGQSVFDLLSFPFYHPVVEEGLRTALRHMASKVENIKSNFELYRCEGHAVGSLN